MFLILQYNDITFIWELTFLFLGYYYYWYQLCIIWGIHYLHPTRRAFIDSFRLKLRRYNIFMAYAVVNCCTLLILWIVYKKFPHIIFLFVLPARVWFRSGDCTQVNLLHSDLVHVQQIIILNVARIVFSNSSSTAAMHEKHI